MLKDVKTNMVERYLTRKQLIDRGAGVVVAIAMCREASFGARGVSGEIVCPKCSGRLRYSIAGSNGHIWGTCETKGCLRWIQ